MFLNRGVIRQWHDLLQHVLDNGFYVLPGNAVVGMHIAEIFFQAYEHEDYDYYGRRSGGYYQLTADGWRITSTPFREPQVFGDRKKMIRDMLLVKLSGVLDDEAD